MTMHATSSLRSLALAAALAATLLPASAPSHAQASAPAAGDAVLTDGEITRWDPATLRLTLRHGAIANLEMGPMTMVFRVQDASLLGGLRVGDKVRFHAERAGAALQVTHIEKAP